MISKLLSLIGITDKVRMSLIPERQDVQLFPKSYQIKYEDISFKTKDDLQLKGWWIKGSSDITIVLSHSFGANRSGWKGADANGNFHKINWLPSIKKLVTAGYNILAFDHRACGESEGNLTYFGKKEALDIEAAIEFANHKNNKLTKFGIIGFSSGANATLRAIRHLEQTNKYKLIGIAANIYWYKKMIKNSMKFFANTPTFMAPIIRIATTDVVGFNPKIEIDPSKIISKIKSPILLVNAEDDEIASIKDIIEIYKQGVSHSSLEILNNESRFDAYHFIEKHSEIAINFINNNLNN